MAMIHNLRTMRWAAWLGWQMESNWANPFLFIVYSIAKPIAGSLILVVMYTIIAGIPGSGTDPSLFSFIYVGNAFFMYVMLLLWHVTWVIHDDREHFQTIRYIYIAPFNYFVYILGRTMSNIVITTFGVLITLVFGVLVLDVNIGLGGINWPLFLGVMVIGLLGIMAFGLALAGVSFLTAKHSMGMNEGIGGLFYVFCGVIFPVSGLPPWGVGFSKVLPVTYWLHLVRTSLGVDTSADTALASVTIGSGLWVLIISTLILTALALLVFKLGDHIARTKGLIDMTTAY